MGVYFFLPNIFKMIPMIATTAVIVAEDKNEAMPPASKYDKQMIQPVMLVPILAPKITPIACETFIMPELTKPTTMTEAAEEDWMTHVTAVPNKKPFKGELVSRYKMSSSLFPATFLSPSPIEDMPYKKRATPQSRFKIINTVLLIILFPFRIHIHLTFIYMNLT